MVAPIRQATDWSGYDSIIDVRTPKEFADDHIPDSINLPVLSNHQREEIGKIYKQDSPFKARLLGAQYAARNIAEHLDLLMSHDIGWRPLVYCWRGGQRSESMARILAEIGWVTTVLSGGYKTYRKSIIKNLETLDFQIVLLQGPTGSAKTRILNEAAAQGAQIIDLESLANHRGSLLGADPEQPQPSQRLFETRLHEQLSLLDKTRPVLVEAESSKIGECHLPQRFWQLMSDAPQIQIDAELASRVNFLLTDYAHLVADPSRLSLLINGMAHRHGHEVTQTWQQLVDTRDWPKFVELLITQHYDPAYKKSNTRKNRDVLGVVKPTTLDAGGITEAASRILALLSAL